jgi:K+-sensing histidine kinase KdpD
MWGKQTRWRCLRAVTRDILLALALSLAAIVFAGLLFRTFGLDRVGVLFLAAVAITGTVRGRRAALIAALVNVASYRLFLRYEIQAPAGPFEDLLNAAVFLTIALLTGTLAGRLRDGAEASRRRALTMEKLFTASRALLAAEDEDAAWQVTTRSMADLAGSPRAIAVDAAREVRTTLGEHDDRGLQAAHAALSRNEPGIFAYGSWASVPIADGTGCLGAVAWLPPGDEGAGYPHSSVDILAQVGAAALGRERVSRLRIERDSLEASNRLREALLSSLSHDFRSPLAAIIGSASSLAEYEEKFSPEVRRDLLENILEEGNKLNRYVSNLLNMTRLQAGVLEPVVQRTSIEDVVNSVGDRLSRHQVEPLQVKLSGACEVLADPLLLEQALYNIFDNALKHAPSDLPLEVECVPSEHHCVISICDHGPGMSPENHSQAFNRFYLGRPGNAVGTGLGLSIVKGFVEAMDGSVQALRRRDGQAGLMIAITLPRAR